MKHPHLMHTLEFRELKFASGRGAWLLTEDGDAYLDFFTDVGTASLGYCPAEYNDAMIKMINKGIPVHSPNLYGYWLRDKVAERLCKVTKMDKVFFCNSGAESVEAAIKIARKYWWDRGKTRTAIWTPTDGFHGRTLATLAAGDGPAYHREGFGPLPGGFYHFDELAEIPYHTAAAVMLSPVFGNNDVRVYPNTWLADLRERCDAAGTLLIFDEVQTGSGRTGSYTYARKIGVQPDIVTLAKGLGMGCPVGATLARGEVANALTPGSHFSTFGGNPLSCAFIDKMLDWLGAPSNLHGVRMKGDYIRSALAKLEWPKNIRGEGMLNAFDIDIDGLEYAAACLEQGLLIGAFRAGPGPVKITPPLNISQYDLELGIDKMAEAWKVCT